MRYAIESFVSNYSHTTVVFREVSIVNRSYTIIMPSPYFTGEELPLDVNRFDFFKALVIYNKRFIKYVPEEWLSKDIILASGEEPDKYFNPDNYVNDEILYIEEQIRVLEAIEDMLEKEKINLLEKMEFVDNDSFVVRRKIIELKERL